MPDHGWLVLCPSGPDFELRASSAALVPFFDEVADDQPGEKTGREVRATNCEAPVLLLAEPSLRAGKIRKAELEGNNVRFDNVRATISSLARDTNVPARLTFKSPQGAVTLLEDPDLSSFDYKIRWAGDLDADGSVDLLIDVQDERSIVYLFLSRQGPVNGVWSPIAVTYHGGC
jgi:hypothetical protein